LELAAGGQQVELMTGPLMGRGGHFNKIGASIGRKEVFGIASLSRLQFDGRLPSGILGRPPALKKVE
jgi:hypothetical protein